MKSRRKRSTASKFYRTTGLLLVGIPVTIIFLFYALIRLIWRIFFQPAFNYVVNTGQDTIDWFSEKYFGDEE